MSVKLTNRIFAAALLIASCVPLRADEASRQAKIHEMFNLLHLPDLTEQLIEQSTQRGVQTALAIFPDLTLNGQQRAAVDASMVKLREVLKGALAWSKLEPELTKLYASTYSEETIDALLTFYRSPAGQEMIAKQPTLLTQAGEIRQHALVTVAPQLRQITEQLAEDLQKGMPKQK